MAKKISEQTIEFEKKIAVKDAFATVGPYEGEGPLKSYFNEILEDDLCGQSSYEKAEVEILKNTINKLIRANNLNIKDIDIIIGGDLLNQITSTTFAVKEFSRPFWGLYNACATFSQGMQIAACAIESGALQNAIVTASSHFSSSERQYRTPLEFGSQNPNTSQRTVTASGGVYLTEADNEPYISKITIGKIIDFDQKDPFDMGCAMAPAAFDTITKHLQAVRGNITDYDLIVTGDLSTEGGDILKQILEEEGYDTKNITDCGRLIYDTEKQEVNNGGSGAGCCAAVFCSYLFSLLKNEKISKLLFVPTGALLSTTTSLQKESIPSIAHAVEIVSGGNKIG